MAFFILWTILKRWLDLILNKHLVESRAKLLQEMLSQFIFVHTILFWMQHLKRYTQYIDVLFYERLLHSNSHDLFFFLCFDMLPGRPLMPKPTYYKNGLSCRYNNFPTLTFEICILLKSRMYMLWVLANIQMCLFYLIQ